MQFPVKRWAVFTRPCRGEDASKIRTGTWKARSSAVFANTKCYFRTSTQLPTEKYPAKTDTVNSAPLYPEIGRFSPVVYGGGLVPLAFLTLIVMN